MLLLPGTDWEVDSGPHDVIPATLDTPTALGLYISQSIRSETPEIQKTKYLTYSKETNKKL
ncbi:hypothetical protein Hanom_Chr14g01331581 [Helianthus anomalus]